MSKKNIIQESIQDVTVSIQDEIASKAVRKSTLKSINEKKKSRLKQITKKQFRTFIYNMQKIRSDSKQNMPQPNTPAMKKPAIEQKEESIAKTRLWN